ncbi:MAG: hypothetical protein ACK4GQ_06170 [Candidatus Hadarchaeales archaeon]
MSEDVKKYAVELCMEGREISEIKGLILEKFGVELGDEELRSLFPDIKGDLGPVDKSTTSIVEWLFDWQLERLKKYRELERKMNLPIPDVKANIGLMIQLLEKKQMLTGGVKDVLEKIFEVE